MVLKTCARGALFAAGLALSAHALAHAARAPASPGTAAISPASAGMPVFVHDIDPAAADAVKVVDAFGAAIRSVDIAAAKALLDPGVLILESGGAERDRDAYMAEHALVDAAFLQAARQQPRYRRARAADGLAWVATETIIERDDHGKQSTLLSTETMVLRKSAAGWKIVHIHWSSRPGKR
ncbi:hypothetical protein BH11PSE14_BH11PSE14_14000 [soil metagenome]